MTFTLMNPRPCCVCKRRYLRTTRSKEGVRYNLLRINHDRLACVKCVSADMAMVLLTDRREWERRAE